MRSLRQAGMTAGSRGHDGVWGNVKDIVWYDVWYSVLANIWDIVWGNVWLGGGVSVCDSVADILED